MRIGPGALGKLVRMVGEGTLTGKLGKQVFAILVAAGMRLRLVFGLGAAAVLLGVGLYFSPFMHDYQRDRIRNFFESIPAKTELLGEDLFQQAVILEYYPLFELLCPVVWDHWRRTGGWLSQWRQAQQIASHQAVIGLHPPLVDTNLPLAKRAVEPGFRHPLDLADQVVVQALPGGIAVRNGCPEYEQRPR